MPLWLSTSITTEPAAPASGRSKRRGGKGTVDLLRISSLASLTYSFSFLYGGKIFSLPTALLLSVTVRRAELWRPIRGFLHLRGTAHSCVLGFA